MHVIVVSFRNLNKPKSRSILLFSKKMHLISKKHQYAGVNVCRHRHTHDGYSISNFTLSSHYFMGFVIHTHLGLYPFFLLNEKCVIPPKNTKKLTVFSLAYRSSKATGLNNESLFDFYYWYI